jgi:lysophospholipase L1-like esterase
VLVVMDVSGSMDDANDAGEVKLRAAKAAVDHVLRSGGASTEAGLWTFPGAGSCSPGRSIVSPGGSTSVVDATSQVDALQTESGGTPIGAALQAAADSLSAQGYGGATIVLVTDGLNNCDPDPCEVAKQVVQRGFDLTVDGIGFSAASGTEVALSCIADATGGEVASADDEASLDRVFTDLTRPAIKVEVSAPTNMQAGQTFKVGATVTNSSNRPADDVSVALSFPRDPAHSADPVASPPSRNIGNIPAGASVNTGWTVSSKSSWSGVSARWRGIASAPGILTVKDDGEIAFGAASSAPSGPLLGPAVKNGWPIVIMGDSYSAGEGAGSYVEATPSAAQRCHRSNKTYLADVLRPQQVRIIACSGAVIDDMDGTQVTTDGAFRAVPQLAQLRNLDRAPGAIVLTLGGNDAGFAAIGEACVAGSAAFDWSDLGCGSDSGLAQAEYDGIASRSTRLAALYRLIWDEANSPKYRAQRNGAYAPVIVSTYPEAFLEGFKGTCGVAFDVAEATYANAVADALARSSSAAVAMARRAGYPVYSATDPLRAFQTDHTYCASDKLTWLRRIVSPDPHLATKVDPIGYAISSAAGQEALHPTAAGYRGITANLVQWEAAQVRQEPGKAATEAAADPDLDHRSYAEASIPPPEKSVKLSPVGGDAFQPGQSMDLSADGFSPGTPVAFGLHSALLGLGTALADSKGRALLRARIPDDVEVGRHHLTATGVGRDGRSRTISMSVTVRPSTPIWVLATASVAAISLLALVLMMLRERRMLGRRRRPGRKAHEA